MPSSDQSRSSSDSDLDDLVPHTRNNICKNKISFTQNETSAKTNGCILPLTSFDQEIGVFNGDNKHLTIPTKLMPPENAYKMIQKPNHSSLIPNYKKHMMLQCESHRVSYNCACELLICNPSQELKPCNCSANHGDQHRLLTKTYINATTIQSTAMREQLCEKLLHKDIISTPPTPPPSPQDESSEITIGTNITNDNFLYVDLKHLSLPSNTNP